MISVDLCIGRDCTSFKIVFASLYTGRIIDRSSELSSMLSWLSRV